MSETNDQRIYDRCLIRVGELEVENAKLREQIHWLKQGDILHVLTDQEYIDQCEREHLMQVSIDALDKENAELRELVRDAWGDGHPDRSCEGCDIRDECHNDVERMRKDGMLRFSRCLFELRIEDRMRELGIEVDA